MIGINLDRVRYRKFNVKITYHLLGKTKMYKNKLFLLFVIRICLYFSTTSGEYLRIGISFIFEQIYICLDIIYNSKCYISIFPCVYIYIHYTKVKNPKKGCASFYVSWNIMRKVVPARPTQTNSSKMLLPQYTKRRRRSNLFFSFFFCRFVYTAFYYY